jgi:hypothetical protein
MPDSAKSILADFDRVKTDRSLWDSHWQDVSDFVLPTRDFSTKRAGGEERRREIFDGTAGDACETLASAVDGLLTNASLKWFALNAVDDDLNEDREVRLWLDAAVLQMLRVFSSPQFKFATQIHEVYLDLVAFGTAVMSIVEKPVGVDMGLQFRALPLAECYLKASLGQDIDTVYRKFQFTPRQAFAKWGNRVGRRVLELIRQDQGVDKKRDYIHCVYPREDRDPVRRDGPNKKFASIAIDIEEQEIVHEQGFDEFPFLTPRWSKAASEIYGRSPAMKKMPDIRLINAQTRTMLIGLEKAVDPPLEVPALGIEGPIYTSPGSIIYRKNMSEPIRPLQTQARLESGYLDIAQRQNAIKEGFFLDVVGALPERDRMTTVEINARLAQRLTVMAPFLARVSSELLGPMITRTFHTLANQGQFGPPPELIAGRELEIGYVSPLALSQRASDARNIEQFMLFLSPFVQVNPAIMQNFDDDELVRYGSTLFNSPQRILKSREDVVAMRDEESRRQQVQQDILEAQGTASAAKDAASAMTEVTGAAT